MATKKLKAAAASAPQTRSECAADIRAIGDLQRAFTRRCTEMNDAIAAITATHEPELERMGAEVKRLQARVQAWCEANRQEITDGGKVKFANLLTGMVTWRQRPPSVKITKAEAVIKTLKALGLGRYLRTKEEVDKDAILAAHSAAKGATADDAHRTELLAEAEKLGGVSGIEVVTGLEDFSIEPFEQEAVVA